jgi:hypothetical protein
MYFEKKSSNSGVLHFLGLCCIFSIFLDKAVRGVFAFDFYYNYPIFILFLIVLVLEKGKLAVLPSWFIKGLSALLLSSLFILIVTNRLGFEFWKQVIGILFTAVVYYNVLFVFEFNIKKVFDYYLIFAFWVALFGVVNNGLHFFGVHLTYSVRAGLLYRESSIMGEPFYLAVALTPAISYYFSYFKITWKNRKMQFLVILTCYLLTYSSIAVAGLGISAALSLFLNDYLNTRKNRLILAPLIILPIALLINFLIDNVKLINARVSDTTKVFFSSELQTSEAGRTNASTFALYSNYIIARDSFLNEPLFGSGLGSHPLIYEETFLKYFPGQFLVWYGNQNQQDANSKFLRLMSETGLIGLILFFWAYIKFFAHKSKMSTDHLKELGAINYAIFNYILLCLIRNGNYINVGFFLFFFIYYITYKSVKTHATYSITRTPIYQAS